MDLGLKDRVALVTGGSQGIGFGIARELAAEGVKVAIFARRPEPLAKAKAEIEAAGGTCLTIEGSAMVDADIARAVDETRKAFGDIDILVNNIGDSGSFKPTVEFAADEWRDLFQLNTMSAALFTLPVIRPMIERQWGRIIFISSGLGKQPTEGSTVYSMTKAGMNAMAKGLSNELGPHNITVNVVAPGVVRTPAFERAGAARGLDDSQFEEVSKTWAQMIPMRRFGAPADIAAMVTLLASERGGWVTGAVIPVDGGWVMGV